MRSDAPGFVASSRRAVLAALLASAAPPLRSAPAHALDTDALAVLPAGSRARSMLEGTLRPKVRALPRRRMAQDFAVLLMRSSYAVSACKLPAVPL